MEGGRRDGSAGLVSAQEGAGWAGFQASPARSAVIALKGDGERKLQIEEEETDEEEGAPSRVDKEGVLPEPSQPRRP